MAPLTWSELFQMSNITLHLMIFAGKVWKIPLHIFELHIFGMTDDIWDNSKGKPPPYIWRRRLYCDCKSQTSDNISSRQWCGKLSTSKSHWVPFFPIDDQKIVLLISIALSYSALSKLSKLLSSPPPSGEAVSNWVRNPPSSPPTTIILSLPSNASWRRWLLGVASLNCRSRSILGDQHH